MPVSDKAIVAMAKAMIEHEDDKATFDLAVVALFNMLKTRKIENITENLSNVG